MAGATGLVEQPLLMRAYQALTEMVPKSATVTDDGFTLFTPDTDLKILLGRELNLSEFKSRVLLDDLRKLGVYRTQSGGRGKPWLRYLKMDAQHAVAGASQNGLPPQLSPAPPSRTEPEGIEATPEELNELWEQVSTRLDEYLARIENLEQQLEGEKKAHLEEQEAHARTKAELEELRAVPPPVFVIPGSLVKHLGMKGGSGSSGS